MYKPVNIEEEPWRLDAACRDHPNPRIFLYAKIGRPGAAPPLPTPQDRAKAICRNCPVKEDCLMSGEKEPGVRGEMVYKERKEFFTNLRRERQSIDEAVGSRA